jgi:2-haloacid dehalogenase
MRIQQVYFDLNGTLFDPSVMKEPLGAEGSEQWVEGIFGDTILAAMAETLSGSYRDFSKLMRAAATRRLTLAGRPDLVDEVMSAARGMPPFPDAEEAVETLRAAEIGVGVLTNSSTETARSLLAAAGLELHPVIGSDQVKAFKPDPRVYQRAVEASGHPAEEVGLVAAHSWDVIGAKRAGLQAAWVSRGERLRLELPPEPDFSGSDLADVAEQIVAASEPR